MRFNGADIWPGEVGRRQQAGRDHLQGGRRGGRGDDRRRHAWSRQGAPRDHGQRQRLRRPPRALPGHRLPTVATRRIMLNTEDGARRGCSPSTITLPHFCDRDRRPSRRFDLARLFHRAAVVNCSTANA